MISIKDHRDFRRYGK